MCAEWREILDITTGKYYYTHTEDGTVRWTIPNSEWRKFYDTKSGKAYYCHVKTLQVVWKAPANLIIPEPASPSSSPFLSPLPRPTTVRLSTSLPPAPPPISSPAFSVPAFGSKTALLSDMHITSSNSSLIGLDDSGQGGVLSTDESKERAWHEAYPFHAAASEGDMESLSRLLKEKQEDGDVKTFLDALDGKEHWSALHYASLAGNASIVVELIKRGCTISLQNQAGETALHLACGSGHIQIVRKLLKHGADVNIEDNQKRKPVDIVWEGKPKNWQVLLELLSPKSDVQSP